MILNKFKKAIYFLPILGFVLLFSCSGDESEMLEKILSIEEIQKSILIEELAADVNEIIDQDAIDVAYSGKGTGINSGTCPARTMVRTSTGRTVTLDFGTGCTGRNGKEFAGKIIIEYTKNTLGSSKTVTFDEFSINQNAIDGSKSIVRLKENDSGNPESTISIDITITLTSGEVVFKKGIRVREKIEGKTTRARGDDVCSISGSWESVNRKGVARASTITTNLRREYACRYIVSGVLEISRDGIKATLDFGDGTCDNKATVTDANGKTKEISLKR